MYSYVHRWLLLCPRTAHHSNGRIHVFDFTLVSSTEFALHGTGRSLASIGRDSARIYGRAEQLRILRKMRREKRAPIVAEPIFMKGDPPCIA
jgi:hypothetical protein